MRMLLLDLDTLRADHLGCYGYHRNTSPNIDEIARQGIRFDNYYCADAPCLPSRAGLMTGRFGIHTGVVGHGGTAADMRLEGALIRQAAREMMTHLWRGEGGFIAGFYGDEVSIGLDPKWQLIACEEFTRVSTECSTMRG